MIESIENNKTQKDKIRYFSDTIQSIKAELAGEIGYKKVEENYINTILFKSDKEVTEEDVMERKKLTEESLVKYKKLKEKVHAANFLNNEQKKFFIGTINESILELTMIDNRGIYIEAEKGGYKKLDPDKKEEFLKKIDKVQNIIYGPKISDSPQEKDIIVKYLGKLLNKNKDKLNVNEQNIFENFLRKYGFTKNKEKSVEKKEKQQEISQEKFCDIIQMALNIYGIDSLLIKINKETKEVFKDDNGVLNIPGERNKDKVKEYYEEIGIDQKAKIIIDSKASAIAVTHVFDGKKIKKSEIKIPASQKSFTIQRVCELLDHELTHFITSVSNANTLNTTGKNYLQLQEGVAMLNENAVTKEISNKISEEPTVHNITDFIGENYGGEECKQLLRIYYKLVDKDDKKAGTMADTRLRRIKRRHDFDLPGANRKDVVYRRGLSDVLKYLEGIDRNKEEDIQRLKKDIKNFYASKLGKENMNDADNIFDGLGIKEGEIIMPFALGKIVYEKILENKVNSIDDIRFLASENKLNYKQIKILLQIIQLMKESKSE